MIPEKKTNANLGVGLGLVLQIAGNILQNRAEGMGMVGLIVILIGAGFFIWGCVNYAQGKGYSGALGLLGLLSCLGLLVLVFLPDKR
jgi:hypothetical protein